MTNRESRDYVRALGVAFILGLVVGAAAVAFLALVHGGQHLLWHDLPDALGYDSAPWWLVLGLPAIGGIVVALAIRLPGNGGHHPVDGFGGPPVTMGALPSTLLAALFSLSFGVVLGPEAPLLAIGTAISIWVAVRVKVAPTSVPLFAAAGSLAAIATILGNPLSAVALVAELMIARAGAKIFLLLLPGMVAAGSGSLIFLGVSGWGGLGEVDLSIPGVPIPTTLSVADILWSPVIGVVGAVILIVILRVMRELRPRLDPLPSMLVHPVGGLAVGALALLFSLTNEDAEALLFSGQTELPEIITWTSFGLLTAYVVLKAAAYVISAAAGFRGGLIFPLIAIAVAVGTALSTVLPGLELAPAIAAAIAASLAGGMRMPLSGVVFSVMLMGAAGVVTTPVAIFAAAAAFIVAEAVHRRELAGDLPGGSSATTQATTSATG